MFVAVCLFFCTEKWLPVEGTPLLGNGHYKMYVHEHRVRYLSVHPREATYYISIVSGVYIVYYTDQLYTKLRPVSTTNSKIHVLIH